MPISNRNLVVLCEEVLEVGEAVQETPMKELGRGTLSALEQSVIPEQTFNLEAGLSLCSQNHPTRLVIQHIPG